MIIVTVPHRPVPPFHCHLTIKSTLQPSNGTRMHSCTNQLERMRRIAGSVQSAHCHMMILQTFLHCQWGIHHPTSALLGTDCSTWALTGDCSSAVPLAVSMELIFFVELSSGAAQHSWSQQRMGITVLWKPFWTDMQTLKPPTRYRSQWDHSAWCKYLHT